MTAICILNVNTSQALNSYLSFLTKKMSKPITDHVFFIGVAGTGMSALAQYLGMQGRTVGGSDRCFNDTQNLPEIYYQLEAENVNCFAQDGSGISPKFKQVVISTAIEESNPELIQARKAGLNIIHRSDLLAAITQEKRTIAISGTSGKSTVSAMVWHILNEAGLKPSLISGAGINSLTKQGLIGNAWYGEGEWLVIEADESDGTLTRYAPETGVILNLDKDHKEIAELEELFKTFRSQVQKNLIINQDHPLTQKMEGRTLGFGTGDCEVQGLNFNSKNFEISFEVHGVPFKVPAPGRHNMENALAAIAVAQSLDISLDDCSRALKTYPGIYRRHQIITNNEIFTLVDDYAHNPAKIAASIRSCYSYNRIIAWFQPHGYGPTRFLRDEFAKEISGALRKDDLMIFSEIYYAGGTVTKDISAADLCADLTRLGKKSFFVENRKKLPIKINKYLQNGDCILLMGARDPSLGAFAIELADSLVQNN
jgi:UDP-N-acetylmuramate--alanine ligase